MNGEIDPEDRHAEKSPTLNHGDEISEGKLGLKLLGLCDEVVGEIGGCQKAA